MDVTDRQIPIETLFELMCQKAEIGCWVLDVKTNRTWWSDSYFALLGIDKKQEVLSIDEFLDQLVHPDDRHLVTGSFKNFFFYHAKSDSHDLRLRHRNGNFNWYNSFSEAQYDAQDSLQYLFGGIVNIDAKKKHAEEAKKLNFIVDVTEGMMGIGTFERSFFTDAIYASKTVYDIFELPYSASFSNLTKEDFYDESDARRAFQAIAELKNEKKPIDIEMRIITAKKNTLWIRVMAKPVLNHHNEVVAARGSIQKIEKQKLKENFLIDIRNRISEQKFFLDETSSMSDVGGWEFNLETHSLYWSDQIKKIHEVEKNFVPTFDNALAFYEADSGRILMEHYNQLVDKGEPFDAELKLVTAKGRNVWVRFIGKPVYHLGSICKARGVIQNITPQKEKELELKAALQIIEGQNSKLKDFTYIVSHNLHSHAGNLKMITDIVEVETDMAAKLEWINMIKNVSVALNETVNNLNGLVSLSTEIKKQVSFVETFAIVSNALAYTIMDGEVEIVTDFTGCEAIAYVPAYLESIMLNLLSNAIKYKHPHRKAVINLRTGTEKNKPFMQIKDNGSGIDLDKFGARLFKMNQTFHHNSDARGIGLYITKNQIENMGGTIEADSVVNEGTTFTVHF